MHQHDDESASRAIAHWFGAPQPGQIEAETGFCIGAGRKRFVQLYALRRKLTLAQRLAIVAGLDPISVRVFASMQGPSGYGLEYNSR